LGRGASDGRHWLGGIRSMKVESATERIIERLDDLGDHAGAERLRVALVPASDAALAARLVVSTTAVPAPSALRARSAVTTAALSSSTPPLPARARRRRPATQP